MHRNRTWLVDSTETVLRTQRNRILPIEGGDGSTLSLDFTTGVLDPRLTFTRSTTGTYINSSGYVATASTNVARFDYDPTTLAPRGLLIEASANNLLFWSESFATSGAASNWGYNSNTGAVVTTDNPAGGTTAFQFAETANSGPLQQSPTVTNVVHTFSAWFKGSVYNSVTTTQVAFGLYTTGFIAGTASIVSGPGSTSIAGNIVTLSGLSTTQWTRVQFTTSAAIPAGLVAILIYPQSTGFEVNRSFYIWGAQLESGSGASSYIPSGASQGSRAADICYADNISSWYTQGIGTMLFVGRPIQSITRNYLGFSTGTNPPRLLLYGSTATEVALYLENSTSATLVVPSGSTTLGSVNRMAASFEQAGYSCVLNGGTVGTSTTASPAMPTSGINRMNIGMRNDQLNQFYGHVVQVKYWPYRLPNAQLQSLTT